MNPLRPTRIQWLSVLFPLPLVVLFFLYLLIDFTASDGKDLFYLVLVFLPLSLGSWYTCVLINNFITYRLPEQSDTVRRGMILFATHFAWLMVLVFTVFGGLARLSFLKVVFIRDNLLSAILLGAVFNIIFCIIWQVEYIFTRWRTALGEKEWMERQLLQQEFDRLKEQLNPHFLFNNLNVLSSLISDNPPKASYYLDELSKIYRYLLRRGEADFATLDDELNFIKSYTALLGIRFGETVRVNIEADGAPHDLLLPTLSLQLLVENAIKHNLADRINPLRITIRIVDNACVIVSNNLQARLTTVASHHIGLANIQTKYRMMSIEDMSVKKTAETFEVRLPLIRTLEGKAARFSIR